MKKIFWQMVILGLGIYLTYSFGRDAFLPVRYWLTGKVVEGRISGFLSGNASNTVLRGADGRHKGKRRARYPVFLYPVGTDSLEGQSSTAALTLLSNYSMYERVTVVYDPDSPNSAYLFGFQIIIGALLCIAMGLYACKIGITGRV